MSNAADLLYQYQTEERAVESAEVLIKEARERQLSIFKEITKDKKLTDALEGSGVLDSSYLMTIDSPNSTVICMRPAPTYSYELSDADLEVPF